MIAGRLVTNAMASPLTAWHFVPAGHDVLLVPNAQRDSVCRASRLAPVSAKSTGVTQHCLAVDPHAAEEPVIEEEEQSGLDAFAF